MFHFMSMRKIGHVYFKREVKKEFKSVRVLFYCFIFFKLKITLQTFIHYIKKMKAFQTPCYIYSGYISYFFSIIVAKGIVILFIDNFGLGTYVLCTFTSTMKGN